MITLFFDKDVGTLIRLDTETDLSLSTSVEIVALSPTGDTVALSGTVVSSTKIQHIKAATTLNMPGVWSLQAHAIFTSTEFYGQKISVQIGRAIVP